MSIKRRLAAMLIGATVVFGYAAPANAVIVTDIIMIVDESGSMGDVQANLRNNIGLFASILSAGGVNARYGLVGYGSGTIRPRMMTDLTTAANFATAAQGLLTNGGTEPGYTATAFALNALDNQGSLFSYRTGALKNLIIFTDEPSNGDTAARGTVGGAAVTQAIADSLLSANNAFFNAVLDAANTIASYDDLYNAHNGQLFSLAGLNTTNQTVVEAFVTAFATAKLQEIVDFCTLNPTDPACTGGPAEVPEPTSLSLLALALLGFAARRRIA